MQRQRYETVRPEIKHQLAYILTERAYAVNHTESTLADLAEDEGRLGEEPDALHDDFVSVAIIHQSSVHAADLVGQHDVLRCAIVLRRESAK